MRILVCPLNWGLGHASRDIPLIREALAMGHHVIIAADGPALEMLRSEYPAVEHMRFPSPLLISYSRRRPAWLKIALYLPAFIRATLREHRQLKKIIKEYQVDRVVSDNRYGLWHSRIPSLLITHQLNPRLPRLMRVLERPLSGVIRCMVRRFHRCWVPDFPGADNLTGDLSHLFPLPRNALFTGPLSRFLHDGEDPEGTSSPPAEYPDPEPARLVILVSGPEPQRTLLENIMTDQARNIDLSTAILQGLPDTLHRKHAGPRLTLYSHLPSHSIRSLLVKAEYIICRAGYTTIMDLVTLGKTAMLIPTPGQTEQQYLARWLSAKGFHLMMEQKNFNLREALRLLDSHVPGRLPSENTRLDEELNSWLTEN